MDNGVNQLGILINAYGTAVRAGVITPQVEDEVYFRQLMDLPPASPAVVKSWSDEDGVRKPITLVNDADASNTAKPITTGTGSEEGGENV